MNIIRIPDAVRVLTDTDSRLCTCENNAFVTDDVRVEFALNGCSKVTMISGKTPVRFIGLRFNGSFEKGTRFLGDSVERGYAEYAFRGHESEREMAWYFIASSENTCAGYGVKTGCNSIAFWTTDAAGIQLWLDVRCGGDGVIRNGEPLELCSIVCDEQSVGRDGLFDFIHNFCLKMASSHIFPKTPVYGSNNWYYAYGDSSAEQILKDTEILAKCSKGIANRPYMVIDDCWQPLARTGNSAQGRPIYTGNELFPDMKGLADAIKAKDIHPGIWFRPLRTEERFINKNYLIKRNDSHKFLDPSVPEALALIAEDTERITGEWGYELIKYDFVTRDLTSFYGFHCKEYTYMRGWSFADRSKTTAMVTKDLYRTIYEHSNGAVIIGCNVMGHLATGYIHMHRCGDDTSGRCFDRSVAYGINSLAFRLPQHKAFFDIDADCVCITNDIPWKNNRDFLELYALSGTPLFVSYDPAAQTPEIDAALTEAYKYAAEQKNVCRPLDWMDNNIPAEYMIDGHLYKYRWIVDDGRSFIYSR